MINLIGKSQRATRSSEAESAQSQLGASEQPKLASRRQNKRSSMKSGRTIGERREKLETASERFAARKKVKKRQNLRIVSTVVFFIVAALAVVFLVAKILEQRELNATDTAPTAITKAYTPTIEIIDENSPSGASSGVQNGAHSGTQDSSNGLTARMREYIGLLEADLKELGLTPVRAVVPAGSIREVDFYLENVSGFIKTTIDRSTGVTAEDAERMLRYLASINVSDFTYIDVRIDGKAYWK